MRSDQQRYRTFARRTALLAGGKALLLSTLVGRMYYLQVVESEKYAVLADENRINLRLLPPPRGRIYDRFGVPIAVNDQNYRVVIIAEQTPDLEATLSDLSQIIPLSESERARILRERARKRAFVPITVRDNLTWEQVARIEVSAPDLPGVSIEVGQTRDYPFKDAVAHVLGYVAAVSESELSGSSDPLLELPGFRIGKTGIEKRYDELLRGSAGTSQVEVNAVGRVIRELSRNEGQPGKDLILTIDMALQEYTQQRLATERSGAAVVLDIHSGDVLAMGSTPSFDPNAFNIGISWSAWEELISDPLRPLTNKAISGQYAPGSTFKMVVALAALEAGINPRESVFCPGYTTLGKDRFHCWKRFGHGHVDMVDGIKHSCDVYFYEIARRVGIDAIAAMARRFGLGGVSGLGLSGESAGLIPDRDWKRGSLGQPWYPGETLVAGIGQGYILTTPLQLAVMTARIANGGYAITPRLVRQGLAGATADPLAAETVPSLGVPSAHLALIRDAMDRVTNDLRGTAYAARIEEPGMAMAGKTGTAQVRRITMSERLAGVRDNEDLPWIRRDHALFVAFAPVRAPAYAVAVVIEHGGGGAKVAAPIARDILLETQLRDPGRRLSRQRVAEAGSG
jgi:penicillin-binding protein 2